jgi:hypothetical protein
MSHDETARRPSGTTSSEVSNEDEVAREFPAAENVSLREQRDLVDDDGDDIRQYTGEPVETEHGTVIPQQSAVGAEQVVGGGEFPNDHRPPAQADEPPADPVEGTASHEVRRRSNERRRTDT